MDRTKEFLSTISHEIRTPLTSIKGFSKTMLESYDNLTDEQKKKFLKIISEQSQRLINLVENALTAADSEEKYNNLVLKKTDVNLVLKKAVELVKINYKEVIFKEILTPYLYSPLDVDKFQQILVNLLDNAAKYGRGYVEIKTGLKDTKVFIQLKNSSEPLKNFELDKIFEKFYRCQTYLTSKKEGSGLGLYIVKMLTEKMNGKIFVKSDNETIEFTLEFPLFAPEEFTKGAHIV